MTNLTHVRVKPGVLDEEFGNDMGGWSGSTSTNPNHLLTVSWDGPTLRKIPDANIRHCIDKGYSYEEYWLDPKDLEPIAPVDTPAQTAKTLQELEDRYHDYSDYGLKPFPFVTHPNFTVSDGLPRTNENWFAYLRKSLKFPFEGLSVEGHFLPYRAEVTITGFAELTDRYGIMVEGRMLGMDYFVTPLANLMGLDARKKSTKLLEWYRVWFANR